MIELILWYIGIVVVGSLIGTGFAHLEYWFKNRHKREPSEGAWNKWF